MIGTSTTTWDKEIYGPLRIGMSFLFFIQIQKSCGPQWKTTAFRNHFMGGEIDMRETISIRVEDGVLIIDKQDAALQAELLLLELEESLENSNENLT